MSLLLTAHVVVADRRTRSAPEARQEFSKTIARLFDDRDPSVRAGVAYVLGWLPELRALEALLRSRLTRDHNAEARASALIALGMLGAGSPETIASIERHFAACTDEAERFAAAFSLAHCAREATPTAALVVLARACADPSANSRRFPGIPADISRERMPRLGLVAAGEASLAVLPIILDALIVSTDRIDASFLAEDALALVFGDSDPSYLEDYLSGELSEAQRRMLRAFADAPILWESSSGGATEMRRYGWTSNREALLAAIAENGRP